MSSSFPLLMVRLSATSTAVLEVGEGRVVAARAFPQAPCLEVTQFLDKTVVLALEMETGTEVSVFG